MKLIPFIPLSVKSKKSLYKPFIFYKTSPSFLINSQKFLSFKNLLVQQTSKIEDEEIPFLIRAQILHKNNFFWYLNIGKKFTLGKPKIKSQLSSCNDILIFLHKSTLKDLTLNRVQVLLNLFQCKSLKFNRSSVLTKFLENLRVLHIKKLVDFSITPYYKFLFLKENVYPFSIFQKKIKFYQFNLFFKKI